MLDVNRNRHLYIFLLKYRCRFFLLINIFKISYHSSFFENWYLLSGRWSWAGWDKKPTLTIHLSHSPCPYPFGFLSPSPGHLPTLNPSAYSLMWICDSFFKRILWFILWSITSAWIKTSLFCFFRNVVQLIGADFQSGIDESLSSIPSPWCRLKNLAPMWDSLLAPKCVPIVVCATHSLQ